MRLCFLISAYRDARHLRDLINSLPTDAEYYVHIDLNSDIRRFEEKIDRDNVHYIHHRVRLTNGGISEVEAQVELIRAALFGGNGDYLVSLSGADYPLWSNSRIADYMANAEGRQLLGGISMVRQGRWSEPYRRLRPLASRYWKNGSLKDKARAALGNLIEQCNVSKTLRIHCPGKTYSLYKGSPWWAITPELGKLIVDEWDNNNHLTGYFKTSYRPVETFIPTVAFNSAFASECMLTEGRYEGLAGLSPLTFIDDANPGRTFYETDFNVLKESGKMFCHGVVTGYSEGLMRLIDADRK